MQKNCTKIEVQKGKGSNTSNQEMERAKISIHLSLMLFKVHYGIMKYLQNVLLNIDQLLKKLVQKNSKIQSIISSLLMIADGYFQIDSKKVVTNYIKMPHVLKYQSFFIVSSSDNYFLLFQVGLHKLTSQANDDIITFDVIQKITFVDIFFYQKAQEFTESLLSYQLLIQKDFYRVEFDQIVCSSPKLPQKAKDGKEQSYLFAFENKAWPESIFKKNNEVIVQYLPLQFKPLIVSRHQYTLDQYTGRYIETLYFERWKKFCQNEQIGNQNKYKLKQVADFQSAGFIIDLLQKTPDFKIKLSPQEREVVSTPNNALVIGRSGTGKTTSQILRIFAFETFIKVRCKILGVKKLQILNDYYGKDVCIHSIFTTANSYLVKEVEKYYHKLENQAHEAVTKHRQSKTSNLDESFVSQTQSDITQYEYDVLDFLQTEKIQIQLHLQNDDHQFHQNEMNQHQEIQSFSHSTFPAFFSTQQLLILLDKQMSKPFFSIDMLQKFREKHSKQIGFLDCNGINLDQHYPNRENRNYQSSYYSSHQNKQQVIVPEVDFPIFYQQFWPTVAPRLRNNQDSISLPSLVWTQIYSYIKGSQYSYAYPNQYLPLALYKERVENYFNSELITQIYTYFQFYEEWKKKIQYFDQMDIVNNLLVNIENGHYTHFPIHYFYIDEVQDLPQALIELFCKITEQGVMFSGDTAQCILKGVGFRFQDLQTLFKNSKKIGANDIEKFQVYQLTTNFRSHNNILQLANCIVTILELLFPKTLDHLKKEISNLKGPKPVFFKNSDYQDIFKYLDNKYYAEEQCEIEFGYNQVVIVKNDEAKQHLPDAIKLNALVLTTFQAKGLEFDDVIIYNCFTFEPLSKYQWEFLSCLDVRETFIEKSIFDANVTKHQNETDEYDDYEFTKDGQVKLKKLILNQRFDSKKSNDYSSLCNELKTFYVCVTRAKKRVLIFDDQPEQRYFIEKLLQRLGVCDMYPQEHPQGLQNQQVIKQNQQKQMEQSVSKQSIQIEKDQVKVSPAVIIKQEDIQQQQNQKRILSEEELQMWEKQGQQMFQRKVYDEAIKCFKRSQNVKMQELSRAYLAATQGSQKLAMFNTYLLQYEKQKQPDLKNKMEELQKEFQRCFNDAAKQFIKLKEYSQAANCYYSGQQYIESLILFLNSNQLQQAAKSAKHLKYWKLVVIIHFKMLNFKKCLKTLNSYKVDRFFQYEVLKIGFEFQYVTEEQLIEYLQLQENQDDNIFNQLEEKSRGINNYEVDETEYLKNLCPSISERIELHTIFKEEIRTILNSQIQIDNDLLEMVYEQVKVFWQFYFKIISNKSIIQRHNYENLKQLFDNFCAQKVTEIIKDNEMLQFLIDVLEQLNQFQLLIKLFPDQQNKYGSYLKKNMAAELITQPQFLQNFLQFHFHKNDKSNQEVNKLLKIPIAEIGQTNDLIYCNELFILFSHFCQAIKSNEDSNDYILAKLHQNKQDENFVINIFGNKKQIKQILEYYTSRKHDKHIKEKCWKVYQYLARKITNQRFIIDILSIQEDLYIKNKSPKTEKISQIFQISDQILLYSIIINFIYGQEKHYIKKLFQYATFEQLLLISKLQNFGSQLFQIQSNIPEQNMVFKAVCPIYQIYFAQTPFLNIIGQSFIFVHKRSTLRYYLKNENTLEFSEDLILVEQDLLMNFLRRDLERILDKAKVIKLIFGLVMRQQYFVDKYFEVQYFQNQLKLKDSFLGLIMKHLSKQELYYYGNDEKYKVRKLVYQIATILQTMNLCIPNNLALQLEVVYVDFHYFLSFQSSWKQELSINSLQDWLNYIGNKKGYILEKHYPQLLIYQLNMAAFIFILAQNFLKQPSKKNFEIDYEIFPDFAEIQQLEYHIQYSFKQQQPKKLVLTKEQSQKVDSQEIQKATVQQGQLDQNQLMEADEKVSTLIEMPILENTTNLTEVDAQINQQQDTLPELLQSQTITQTQNNEKEETNQEKQVTQEQDEQQQLSSQQQESFNDNPQKNEGDYCGEDKNKEQNVIKDQNQIEKKEPDQDQTKNQKNQDIELKRTEELQSLDQNDLSSGDESPRQSSENSIQSDDCQNDKIERDSSQKINNKQRSNMDQMEDIENKFESKEKNQQDQKEQIPQNLQQQNDIYLFYDMVDYVYNKSSSSGNIKINTLIEEDEFENITRNLITVLIDLCLQKIESQFYIKILNILYLVCYNCKMIEYSLKEKVISNVIISVIYNSLWNPKIQKYEQLYYHLNLLQDFMVSKELFIPKNKLNFMKIDINDQNQIDEIEPNTQINYNKQLDSYIQQPLTDSYQLVRKIIQGKQNQYNFQNDNGFSQINKLKKFLNIGIQGKSLAYSLRKDLILVLNDLCTLEEEIDRSKNEESAQKFFKEISKLSKEIDTWVETKCTKELRPFFANIWSR